MLLDYLYSNFDPDDVVSGGLFIQTVMYCVQNMQDKPAVSSWLLEQFSQTSIAKNNIILRAVVMNNIKWQHQIDTLIGASQNYDDVPWDKLIDLYAAITGGSTSKVQFTLEGYLNALSSALAGILDKAADRIMPSLVSLAASSGMGLKSVTWEGERKYFINSVVRQLGKMTDLENRISSHHLRHYVDIEVRRMEASGVLMGGSHRLTSLVLISAQEAWQLCALPKSERIKAASKIVRSVDEASDALFPHHWKEKLSIVRGYTASKLAHDSA